jgi:hypothetical protein
MPDGWPNIDISAGSPLKLQRESRRACREAVPLHADFPKAAIALDKTPQCALLGDDLELDLATILWVFQLAILARDRSDDYLFQSTVLRDGQYFRLTAARLASRMLAVMAAVGVAGDFKGHSARAAGMAALKAQGWYDDSIMDRARLRSKYIYRKHYKRGVRGGVVSAGTHLATDVSSSRHSTGDEVSSPDASRVRSTIFGPVATASSPVVPSPLSAASSVPSPSVTLAGGVGLDLSDSVVAALSLSPVAALPDAHTSVTTRSS